jgi:hypothetical protein
MSAAWRFAWWDGGLLTAHRATHEISVDPNRRIEVKRYRSWNRGEPAGEWAALALLDLAGAVGPDVVSAATTAGRILISLDRGLGDIRAYRPGTTPAS